MNAHIVLPMVMVVPIERLADRPAYHRDQTAFENSMPEHVLARSVIQGPAASAAHARRSYRCAGSVFEPLVPCRPPGALALLGLLLPLLGDNVLTIASFTPTYWYIKANNEIAAAASFNATNLQSIFTSMVLVLAFGVAVLAVTLIVGVVYALMNIVVDVVHAMLDPRVAENL